MSNPQERPVFIVPNINNLELRLRDLEPGTEIYKMANISSYTARIAFL